MKTFIVLCVAVCWLSTLEAAVFRRQTEDENCPDKCKNLPLDISFVVDASASIYQNNFTEGLWFIENFVDKFDIGTNKVRVSLLTFSHMVHTEHAFGFDQHTTKSELKQAIQSIPYSGGHRTETGMGIKYHMDHFFPQGRDGVRQIMIVLTDGNSQDGHKTKTEAEAALATGLEVFAIGVGEKISEQELHNIASDGRHVFRVASYNALDDIVRRLAYETCGMDPEPQCSLDPTDIMLVIDSSASIGEGNFTLGLEFIKEYLEVFEINPSSMRVAAIMFSDRVHSNMAIPFDIHHTKKQTVDAIMALKWQHGSATETGAGINYMVDNFVPHCRPHSAHIGVVITDGKSQRTQFTADAAKRAREAGVTMYAVGIGKTGDSLDQTELNNIAGSHERVITADDYSKLNLIRSTLTDLTCVGITSALQGRRVQMSPQ